MDVEKKKKGKIVFKFFVLEFSCIKNIFDGESSIRKPAGKKVIVQESFIRQRLKVHLLFQSNLVKEDEWMEKIR